MSRRLPTYTADRMREAVASVTRHDPDLHAELIADHAAFLLAGYQADDEALDDASRQVLEHLARAR